MTPKLHERFWSKVNKNGPTAPHMTTPCWIYTGYCNKRTGYGDFQVKLADGRFVSELAHRVAWALTHGKLPENNVCHQCDIRNCMRPSHLWEGTYAENSADMVAKGRQARGAAVVPATRPKGTVHYEARVTEDDVRDIRAARANGISLQTLATRHNVTTAAIWNIAARKSWKHVL